MSTVVKRNGEVIRDGRLIGHVYKCDGLWVRSFYRGSELVCLGGLSMLRKLAVADVVKCAAR